MITNHSYQFSTLNKRPYKIINTHGSHGRVRTYRERYDDNRGFIEADNSGRSNIFSTGEKALYSYSPVAEDAAKRGLGGSQGIAIVIAVIILVSIITARITAEKESFESWSLASTNIDPL